jgi:hypothetical protein
MFDTINYLLFEKRKSEIDPELLDGFSPYMISRYYSFTKKGAFVKYINQTLNKFGRVFESSDDMFKLYENLIITQKREKIPYVKRSAQKEKSKQEDKIIPEFYSKREWEMLTNDTMITKQ